MLEQYGRGPLIRVPNVPEGNNVGTTDKIMGTVAVANIPLERDDIIITLIAWATSTGTENVRDIGRLKAMDLLFHLVKTSCRFKHAPMAIDIAYQRRFDQIL